MPRLFILGFLAATLLLAQTRPAAQANDPVADALKSDPKPAGELIPLNKGETVLLDAKGKKLLLKSEVVLREGLLELLVCLKRTKEHESILSVDAPAQIIHAGLLALGAKQGSPVRWQPEFQAATGQPIDIFLLGPMRMENFIATLVNPGCGMRPVGILSKNWTRFPRVSSFLLRVNSSGIHAMESSYGMGTCRPPSGTRP